MTRMPAIIPPIILERVAERAATPEERAAARRSLLISERLRGLREERAVEPQEGEDRAIHDAEGRTTLPGRLVRAEDSPDVDDVSANEAYDAAGGTYSLYQSVYGRRSIDNNGMRIVSTVHYDRDFDNAFWDGQQIVYGDGHYFNRFTASMDVIGHELAHGVTQYTAELEYRGQPGALNEHISDVFGSMVRQRVRGERADQASWLIGEDLMTPKIRGRALRDMRNPGTAYDDPVIGKDPQPADMDHYVDTREDNGGVHINSGIPNRAFCLACLERGGEAWLTIGKVWYETLLHRTSQRTEFVEFAASTYASAQELFGQQSAEALAIRGGWEAVGIDPVAVPAPDPTPSPDRSPCEAELLALLRDPLLRVHLATLAVHPTLRRLQARARRLLGP